VPVYFKTISPWDKPDRMQPEKTKTSDVISNGVLLALFFIILAFGILLANRNLRVKRGDSRGAFRLALGVFLMMWVSGALFAHHVPTIHELSVFWIVSGWALIFAALVWLLYIGLEPHVRRRWPNSLVSWTRLLTGQVRDPIVGRDLLVGILTGTVWNVVIQCMVLIPKWMGKTPLAPNSTLDLIQMSGIRIVAADLLLNATFFIFGSLAFFFVFFLLRLLLRREWIAAVVLIALIAGPELLGDHPLLNAIGIAFVYGIAMVLLIRFGLLALLVAFTLRNMLSAYPLTAHVTAWYGEPTIFVYSVLLAIAIFAFYTSTAGKPLFGSISLD
jgi:hypothetical protein